MSAAAERIQRAHNLVRRYRNTPLRGVALAHLRDVVDAVKREDRARRGDVTAVQETP